MHYNFVPSRNLYLLVGLCTVNVLSTAYRRVGLTVNSKKTEVLSLPTNHDSPASLCVVTCLFRHARLRIWGAY